MKVGLTKWFFMSVLAFAGTGLPVSALAVASPALSANVIGRDINYSFKQLGANQSFDLRGLSNEASVSLGIRLDETVRSARLRLKVNYSPALIAQLSHIKIYLNNEVAGFVPVPEHAGNEPYVYELALDPRLFSDYNQLRMQLIGHFTRDCEDPAHTSIWASISNQSELLLRVEPLALQNDLALLPAPFFDRHDSRRLVLPFVFANSPDSATVQAAGIASSWFGAKASYRGARFPVQLGRLPASSAIIWLRNGEHIQGLTAKPVSGPRIYLISLKQQPAIKYLVIQGRDGRDLKTAASALVLSSPVMSGSHAGIRKLDVGPQREPYDAPNWVRTDRPVRFGDLVSSQYDLQRSLENRSPIKLDLHLPPDLFTWRSRGIDLDLRYRYTPPLRRDSSNISILLNDQFVRAFALSPSQTASVGLLKLPLIDGRLVQAREDLAVPPFYVGAANSLQIRYAPEVNKHDLCSSQMPGGMMAAIDPDSTIDFSKHPHYIAMPNMQVFASAGFPFTRYADLSETAVLIPDHPAATDLSAFLAVMGRMGSATGYPALRYALYPASRLDEVDSDRDILLVGLTPTLHALQQWRDRVPFSIDPAGRVLSSGRNLIDKSYRWFDALGLNAERQAVSIDLSADGRLASLMGFKSPLSSERSVVAMTATSADAMTEVLDVMDKGGMIGRVQGDLVLVSHGQLQDYRVAEPYYLGHLPLWTRLWLSLSDNPLMLALAAVGMGLFVAMLMFFGLNHLARKRLVK